MNRKFAALYTFTYLAIGSFTPLIGQYLSSEGMNGTEIGTVTAAGTLVAVFSVAIWGKIYNAAGSGSVVIAILCAGALLLNIALLNVSGLKLIALIYGAMYFFQAPVMSLVDAYTVVGEHENFGVKRAWGAVGFAAGVFAAGMLADFIGIKVIFTMYEVSYAIAIVSVIMINHSMKRTNSVREKNVRKNNACRYSDLLKSRRLVKLLICTFFIGGTNVANNTYFSFLYIEGGGTMQGVGICMLLMVGSEIPFMAFSRKLSSRFTIEKTLFAAMAVSVMRFVLYGTGLPWWGLMLLFFTQGAVNGIILVEFVRYVSACAPDGCEGLAISAYYVISGNISTIACQLAGGIALEAAGAEGVYLFFGLFNLAGLILYVLFGLAGNFRKSQKPLAKTEKK